MVPTKVSMRSGRLPLDLSLYLVTDSELAASHGLVGMVRSAVAGGVSVVQLRDHDASDDEFLALGRMLVQVLRDTGVPLIVNDRVRLVASIGADGAHIGQGDIPVLDARRMLGPAAYLGLSCTTLEQVQAAADLPEGTVDYLGLGPVWATATKPDHAAPLGPAGLAPLVEAAAAAGLPSVAIGGIGPDQLPRLATSGVDGIAVVSAICAAEDPQDAASRLRDAWTQEPR